MAFGRKYLASAQILFNKRRFNNYMAISANDIRKGMVILFEGAPCKIMEFRHHTPGNLRAMVQARLRNLRTGSSFEHRFRSNDTIDKISLEQQEMEYLYSDGHHHHLMNTETYEQVALTEEELGDAADWLMPNLKIEVELYDGTPIGVKLPDSMELIVQYTEPGLKGATVTNTNKPATLENGVTIQVPPFIESGEKIRVNPAESRYLERVK
jgi:elongation factor P